MKNRIIKKKISTNCLNALWYKQFVDSVYRNISSYERYKESPNELNNVSYNLDIWLANYELSIICKKVGCCPNKVIMATKPFKKHTLNTHKQLIQKIINYGNTL